MNDLTEQLRRSVEAEQSRQVFKVGDKVTLVRGVFRPTDGVVIDISPIGTYQVLVDSFLFWRPASDLVRRK